MKQETSAGRIPVEEVRFRKKAVTFISQKRCKGFENEAFKT